ncbi:hypothetical protein [Streptomyces incanus]|uniref:LacI family transcriptional regulator n=1 Tax=Streptomyces incanus TaxID=887453 RepID=A0ABW0XM25_9ACTN
MKPARRGPASTTVRQDIERMLWPMVRLLNESGGSASASVITPTTLVRRASA